MKQMSISTLRMIAGLILFAAAGASGPVMSGIVQQFDVFGPKQWLTLIAGSLVPAAPRGVIAPFKARLAASRDQTPSAGARDHATAV